MLFGEPYRPQAAAGDRVGLNGSAGDKDGAFDIVGEILTGILVGVVGARVAGNPTQITVPVPLGHVFTARG